MNEMKAAPYRITIHCTDTQNNQWVSIDKIRDDHIARGFYDIGYHFLIQPNGNVVNGRGLNFVGAHVANANTGNIGIALAGDDRFSKSQFIALRRLLDNLKMTYSFKDWELHCHREFDSAIKQGKTCPNIEPSRLWTWYYLFNNAALDPYLIENDKRYTIGA